MVAKNKHMPNKAMKEAQELAKRYSIVVSVDEEGDGFVASCIEWPLMVGGGDSQVKAVEELEENLAASILYCLQEHKTFPQPQIATKRTTQINFRTTPIEKITMEKFAKARGYSSVGEMIRDTVLEKIRPKIA